MFEVEYKLETPGKLLAEDRDRPSAFGVDKEEQLQWWARD